MIRPLSKQYTRSSSQCGRHPYLLPIIRTEYVSDRYEKDLTNIDQTTTSLATLALTANYKYAAAIVVNTLMTKGVENLRECFVQHFFFF
jgi:hypothetical protein